MSIFDASILGIVEGLTEFLPISSTAHLFLAGHLLKLPATEFQKSFDIAIQLGAILSVVVLYWRSLLNWQVLSRLFIAFLPTGIVGLLFYKIAKNYFLGNTSLMLWSLFIGGIVLIIFEYAKPTKESEPEDTLTSVSKISFQKSFLVGLFQSLAIVPGVSRSAATIIGGSLIDIRKSTIVEFSFLLAVPTMAAATGLDLLKNYKNFNSSDFTVLGVGFVISFIVAMFAIKFFLAFIRKKTFSTFGVYRMLVAILFGLIGK